MNFKTFYKDCPDDPTMLGGTVVTIVIVAFVFVGACFSSGCVTTRVMDRDGRVVRETTRWEPPVVVSPVMYNAPVEYVNDYYPPAPVVIYERPYYRPYRAYYERPVVIYERPRVRDIYIGGRPHHRR